MNRFAFLLLGILFLLENGSIYAQERSDKYFRHLRYNHVSPHVSIQGIYEIEKETAVKTSHYLFKYDEVGRVTEIVNNHYHTERRHPLTTLDAYRTVFDYSENGETRTFFDKNGKRITNERQVFKEVYLFDEIGFKSELKFFDLEDQPMESNWNIAQYSWSKHKKMVIEKRYNLSGEPVSVSPYFDFGVTGILYEKNSKVPSAHYNLDESYKVQDNAGGVAVYKDVYDQNGNHVEWSYHDSNDDLVMNQWGFALGKKGYDENGNSIINSRYDEKGELIDERKLLSNVRIKMAEVASREDSAAVREKSLGYLVALQELKPALMEDVMHENLAKRTVGRDRETGKEIIRETTYDQMISFAESWNRSGTRFPPKPNNEVIILDIYDRTASVKLISDNWVEYLHLIKTNGKWDIINLLWQFKDTNYYPD